MAINGTPYPFGLREIKIVSHDTVPIVVSLDAAQTLKFTETVVTNMLRGNDRVVTTTSFTEGADWEIGAGGIPFAGVALMAGRALVASGSGGAEVETMSIKAGDTFPYFTLYGKSIGDRGDDIHVKLPMCKLTGGIEGELKGGDYFISKLKGMAVGADTTGLIVDIARNETAAALPSTV